MTKYTETLRCSFCGKEAKWQAHWYHGVPEYTLIQKDNTIDMEQALYCDEHREYYMQKFRPVP
jgi:hypothetical protein